jgi:hypothetical protein
MVRCTWYNLIWYRLSSLALFRPTKNVFWSNGKCNILVLNFVIFFNNISIVSCLAWVCRWRRTRITLLTWQSVSNKVISSTPHHVRKFISETKAGMGIGYILALYYWANYSYKTKELKKNCIKILLSIFLFMKLSCKKVSRISSLALFLFCDNVHILY